MERNNVLKTRALLVNKSWEIQKIEKYGDISFSINMFITSNSVLYFGGCYICQSFWWVSILKWLRKIFVLPQFHDFLYRLLNSLTNIRLYLLTGLGRQYTIMPKEDHSVTIIQTIIILKLFLGTSIPRTHIGENIHLYIKQK